MDPIDLLVRGAAALVVAAALVAAARARFGIRKEDLDGAADIGLD